VGYKIDCKYGAALLGLGGLHVMLLGLAAPLAVGTEFNMSLQFRDAGVLKLKVPIV
jgi:copper(I)-binding protein